MSAGAILDEELTQINGAVGSLIGMVVRRRIEREAFVAAVEALARAAERLRRLIP